MEIYKETLKKYEEVVKDIEQEKHRVSCCDKGCSCCCYQVIVITEHEKYVLGQVVNKMSLKERALLWKDVKTAVKKLQDNELTPQTIRPDLYEEDQRKVQEKYFKLRLPCVFLKDDICSIYPYRPIACMTYKNYGHSDDCIKSPFVKDAITYNYVEWRLRKELFEKTKRPFDGFLIMPYVLYDIMKKKSIIYEIINLFK